LMISCSLRHSALEGKQRMTFPKHADCIVSKKCSLHRALDKSITDVYGFINQPSEILHQIMRNYIIWFILSCDGSKKDVVAGSKMVVYHKIRGLPKGSHIVISLYRLLSLS